jgi:hypothetical protein
MPLPPVSVALPVSRASPALLRAAFESIRTQTHANLDIFLILNGADAPTAALAQSLAASEPRARIRTLPHASLPAALNTALREAKHDLVARMDADDECPPTRLALQAAFLDENPDIAAIGAAFEGVDERGESLGVERPPTEPAEVRWRLCLGNCFCHGSMMFRRHAILAEGGYDETLAYAQDYDLWLRLSRSLELANLREVLYRYRTSLAKRHEPQARAAAHAMLRHWSTLPRLADRAALQQLSGWLAQSTWGGDRARAALDSLESLLDDRGPSPEALLAWQWIAPRAGQTALNSRELGKLERLREAGRRLRSAGVATVWLYGAGRHTAWLLENRDALGVQIAGLADDALAGADHHGFSVIFPATIPPRAHVVLSSDAHEDRLWHAAAGLRERGITVWRLYTKGEVAISASEISPPSISIGA